MKFNKQRYRRKEKQRRWVFFGNILIGNFCFCQVWGDVGQGGSLSAQWAELSGLTFLAFVLCPEMS